MRALAAIVIAGLALLQAGCATMNQDECLSGDWELVGYQDGTNGYPPSYMDKHAKACAAYGVRPDAATYMAARERGLFEYCTPPRGFREGRMGRKRSEEHTSELQSLMRISYAVFCLKKKKKKNRRAYKGN